MYRRFYAVAAVLAAATAMLALGAPGVSAKNQNYGCYHYCAWHNGIPCGRDHDGWETYDVNEGQWWICRSIAPWTRWEDWDWFAE